MPHIIVCIVARNMHSHYRNVEPSSWSTYARMVWFHDSQQVQQSRIFLTWYALILRNVTKSDAGRYFCKSTFFITHEHEQTLSGGRLIVVSKLAIHCMIQDFP